MTNRYLDKKAKQTLHQLDLQRKNGRTKNHRVPQPLKLKRKNGQRAVTHDLSTQLKESQTINNEKSDQEYAEQSEFSETEDPTTVTSEAEETNPDEWFTAKELIGVKKIAGKRHYRVLWEDSAAPPSWVKEEDVTDLLKENYHIRHTQNGAVRKGSKALPTRLFNSVSTAITYLTITTS